MNKSLGILSKTVIDFTHCIEPMMNNAKNWFLRKEKIRPKFSIFDPASDLLQEMADSLQLILSLFLL